MTRRRLCVGSLHMGRRNSSSPQRIALSGLNSRGEAPRRPLFTRLALRPLGVRPRVLKKWRPPPTAGRRPARRMLKCARTRMEEPLCAGVAGGAGGVYHAVAGQREQQRGVRRATVELSPSSAAKCNPVQSSGWLAAAPRSRAQRRKGSSRPNTAAICGAHTEAPQHTVRAAPPPSNAGRPRTGAAPAKARAPRRAAPVRPSAQRGKAVKEMGRRRPSRAAARSGARRPAYSASKIHTGTRRSRARRGRRAAHSPRR